MDSLSSTNALASEAGAQPIVKGGTVAKVSARSLHTLGVMTGFAAGVWMGAAEAPTKFVAAGISPFLISLGMVSGVFVGRWTVPTVLKGTGYVFCDLREKPHLIIWALLGGALWAVANTLGTFGIRDVGLAIAFPLWNTDSLVGLLWGWLFFRELRGAGLTVWTKVLGGSTAIVIGAVLLGYASSFQSAVEPHRNTMGLLAALGAAVLWGTMFLPYRKAYISGMNPLSFVTIFTVGELITMGTLSVVFEGGLKPLAQAAMAARPALFWLFLGGFCWVIGDLFAQYAAKYVGIGRAAPLMNTNQLWGLAWGALVFGELAGQSGFARTLVIGGSVVMIIGALAISTAVAPQAEQTSRTIASRRECERYGLDADRVESALTGSDPVSSEAPSRRWWDILIVAAAVGVFVVLAVGSTRVPFPVNLRWVIVLVLAMLASLFGCGYLLWKRTQFS
jgi:drug/metabolite transporter (DMT)-like permease